METYIYLRIAKNMDRKLSELRESTRQIALGNIVLIFIKFKWVVFYLEGKLLKASGMLLLSNAVKLVDEKVYLKVSCSDSVESIDEVSTKFSRIFTFWKFIITQFGFRLLW